MELHRQQRATQFYSKIAILGVSLQFFRQKRRDFLIGHKSAPILGGLWMVSFHHGLRWLRWFANAQLMIVYFFPTSTRQLVGLKMEMVTHPLLRSHHMRIEISF